MKQTQAAPDTTATATPAQATAVTAFQINAETTCLDLLPPNTAVPAVTPGAKTFSSEMDPNVNCALAAMEMQMVDVPESVVAAVKRSIEIGRSSRTTYADLAGIDSIAKELRKLVTIPLKQPEFFSLYGLEPPRGVLMHGPPGSGKTRLACAAAAEAEASLMVRRPSYIRVF